jgi:hypothetical protein
MNAAANACFGRRAWAVQRLPGQPAARSAPQRGLRRRPVRQQRLCARAQPRARARRRRPLEHAAAVRRAAAGGAAGRRGWPSSTGSAEAGPQHHRFNRKPRETPSSGAGIGSGKRRRATRTTAQRPRRSTGCAWRIAIRRLNCSRSARSGWPPSSARGRWRGCRGRRRRSRRPRRRSRRWARRGSSSGRTRASSSRCLARAMTAGSFTSSCQPKWCSARAWSWLDSRFISARWPAAGRPRAGARAAPPGLLPLPPAA